MVLDMLSSLVPFLFMAAVVYGALEVSGVFSGNKNVKIIIAAVFAFFTITYEPLIALINNILPYAAVLFIAVFFIAFLFRPLREEGGGKKDYNLIAIVGILVLLLLASYGRDLISDFLPQISSENFMIGAGLIIVVLILYAAYKKG